MNIITCKKCGKQYAYEIWDHLFQWKRKRNC